MLRFDLLPSSGSLGRRAQQSRQASWFHVVHPGPAGQPGDDVDGRSAAQAVVTAGGGSGWGQGLRGAMAVGSGRRGQTCGDPQRLQRSGQRLGRCSHDPQPQLVGHR